MPVWGRVERTDRPLGHGAAVGCGWQRVGTAEGLELGSDGRCSFTQHSRRVKMDGATTIIILLLQWLRGWW